MEKNYRAELVGVFGDPVDGNPTGVMEEAAFKALGLNFRYLTIKVKKEDFADAMKSIKALNMRGMNLTMPHKIMVLDYLDEISEAVKIIGASNTIVVKEDGTLFGENTDGKGFVQALINEDISLSDKTITILGAGGAAKAIAVECALAGAKKIIIANRTVKKAMDLAEVINKNTSSKAEAEELISGYNVSEKTDILINATSIGLHPNVKEKPEIKYSSVSEKMVAVDVVFNPVDTVFLQLAREQGAKTVSGLGMLACQGALNFKLWTGKEAPLDIMEKTLAEEFSV